MKQKIPFSQVSQANGTKAPQLPKYSSSVINSASGYAHATDPKNVGMVSQEIQEYRFIDTKGLYIEDLTDIKEINTNSLLHLNRISIIGG